MRFVAIIIIAILFPSMAIAQVAPTNAEIDGFGVLHAAAYNNDVDAILALVTAGADIDARNGSKRTTAMFL
jgi:hypothetical protein